MTLQQLRYIIAIDEYRHFGKAAEACNLTQSTLSLMVKKLEEELDVKIFNRDAHPVAPTTIGREIIDRAKIVLYNVGQIEELTNSAKAVVKGPLKIALISTVSPVLVPGLFKYIGTKYPDISLQTEEMLTDTVKEKIRRAEVDMGIIAGPVRDSDLLEIPLYHERFYAYISKDHPAYSKESITMEDLYSQPVWIIRDGLRQLVLKDLPPGEEVSYDRFFEGGRVGILIQIVNENGGITVIPESHTKLILFSDQQGLRPIVSDVKRTVSLVVRNDYIRETMLNVVVDAIRGIVPEELQESILRRGHLKL